MKRYRQFEPVVISELKTKEWTHPEHNHNHYELIFIVDGAGTHVINGNAVPYKNDSIFFIGPEEHHYFEIKEETHFIYLKFTDTYIYRSRNGAGTEIQQLEYLIKSRETHHAGFSLAAKDSPIVRSLFNVIALLKSDPFANQDLIWNQLVSIVTLLMRNMPELQTHNNRNSDLQAMFCYIHKNIYHPDLLRSEIMAPHFNLATDYLGAYFKRHVGLTLRMYIHQYRRALIQQRMTAGKMILKEIAEEFGLTDVSHLTKIMKKKI